MLFNEHEKLQLFRVDNCKVIRGVSSTALCSISVGRILQNLLAFISYVRQHSGLNIIFPNNGLEIAKEEADPRAVLRLFRDMKSYFAQIASLPFEVYSQQLLDFLCPNSYDISRFGERIEMNVVNCALIQEAPFFQFNSKLRRNPDCKLNSFDKYHIISLSS